MFLFASLCFSASLFASRAVSVSSPPFVGVWNNSDFSKPASEWVAAAQRMGGSSGIVDLTVALAGKNGIVYLPFPYESCDILSGTFSTDELEPYMTEFESKGVRVIFSIQPLSVDVRQLIDILLSKYGSHKNIFGINVDLEWKNSGIRNHVSNEERDLWLNNLKKYNPNYKLFLTYFKDYTYFPDDHSDIVVLYDGESAVQASLLSQYSELGKHFSSVGIYTGYSSSTPPTASYDRIIDAASNTKYLIHTENIFSSRHALIFEMDDVQVDWLESVSINLTNIHIQQQIPVLVAAIPNNFNQNVGGGYLPVFLENVSTNLPDIVEIGQHGYTHNETEHLKGKSYEEQKTVIAEGQKVFDSIGFHAVSFVAPFGVADENTLRAAADLKFKNFVSISDIITSPRLTTVNNWVSLTEQSGNDTVLKSAGQLMAEVDKQCNATLVVYQIEDFQGGTESKLLAFSQLLETLKTSEKYCFLTMEQYREQISSQAETNPTAFPDTSPYFVIAVVSIGAIIVICTLLLRRIENRQGQQKKKL